MSRASNLAGFSTSISPPANLNVGVVTATTFIGALTGTADATIHGVRVGRGAGAVSTNTAVGNEALDDNTTGSANTAVGYEALYSNTTGGENTANGFQALYFNTTGGGGGGPGVSAGGGSGGSGIVIIAYTS